MNKKKMKSIPAMAKRTAMVIAAVTFVVGFFAGVGFAIYKTNSTPGAATN